jgi:hypothetical protein
MCLLQDALEEKLAREAAGLDEEEEEEEEDGEGSDSEDSIASDDYDQVSTLIVRGG